MPELSQRDTNASPESWARVRREAAFFRAPGGVIATLRPDLSRAQLSAVGNTTTDAARELAVELDKWNAED